MASSDNALHGERESGRDDERVPVRRRRPIDGSQPPDHLNARENAPSVTKPPRRSTAQPPKHATTPRRKKTHQTKTDEYYAEENFRSTPTGGRVYTGPLLLVGFSAIMGCFTMSTATRRSRNLSFKW